MNSNCIWQSEDPLDAFRCTRCGHETPRVDIRVLPYRRTCNVQRPVGFGDWLARLLGWVGFHQKSGCGCARRQKTLNRWLPFDTAIWKARLRWIPWIIK